VAFFITALVLLIPAFEYRRNVPVYLLATFPLFVGWLQNLKINPEKFKSTHVIFLIGVTAVIAYNLFTRLPSFDFYKYNENDYCFNTSGCSVDAVNFLKTNPPIGNGFNFYDWGGYLIGKETPAKLFIDGRMDAWVGSDGYMPFADYLAIYYKNDLNKFNSYNFDWVLVPPDSSIANSIFGGQVQGNWTVKYRDQASVYFVRE
jgi:hypothetical protein